MNGITFESISMNKYYFDNDTGQIIHYNDIEDIESLANNPSIYQAPPSKVTLITTHDLHKFLFDDGNGFKQLILEVTSACNLRCKYCIYSEHYPYTRSHGSSMMSWETAKNAVDYYFDNFKEIFKRNPMRKAVISFYGGEPLVNYNLVEKVINYINEKYASYETSVNITTNGVLFNKKIQDYLYHNKVAILVSLDGYKENHDRNRVDRKGNSTFDKVLRNIRQFKSNHPDGNIAISVCFDYKTDFEKLAEFVDEQDLSVVHTSQIQSDNSYYYNQFVEDDKDEFFAHYNKTKGSFFDHVLTDDYDKSKFLYRFFGSIYGDLAYHPMIREENPIIRPFTGTCIPGEKVYVTTSGDFQICEKINSAYVIGNIYSGLNYENIINVINEYNQEICTSCKNCPISRLCKLCYKNFETENGFEKKTEICKNQQTMLKQSLSEFVSILEKNPKLFEDITIDYYNYLNEAGECI